MDEKRVKPMRAGSIFLWGMLRAGEILILLFVVIILVDASDFHALLRLFMLASLASFFAAAHNFSIGFADGDGLTFRRYFRRFTVSWNDVDQIKWDPRNALLVAVTLEKPVRYSRTVRFLLRGTVADMGAARRGEWVPEVVLFMLNQLRPAA